MAAGEIGDRGMKYYKFTKKDRLGIYQTGYQYPTPGQWTEPVKPVLCEAGYHVCSLDYLFNWKDECLWEVEVRGEAVHGDDKSAFEQIRLVRQIEAWNPKTLRLYAADVAEDVLELFEQKYPDDDRPRKAIQAVRDYANGLISSVKLYDAYVAAAYAAESADYYAAVYAAEAAASAADIAYAADYAADAAYVAAEYAAASAYAAYAAYTKEQALEKYHKWLLERLGIEE
jgi:hypothetical protein